MKNLAEKGGEYELLAEQERSCIFQRDSIKKVHDQSVSNAGKKIGFGQRIQESGPGR